MYQAVFRVLSKTAPASQYAHGKSKQHHDGEQVSPGDVSQQSALLGLRSVCGGCLGPPLRKLRQLLESRRWIDARYGRRRRTVYRVSMCYRQRAAQIGDRGDDAPTTTHTTHEQAKLGRLREPRADEQHASCGAADKIIQRRVGSIAFANTFQASIWRPLLRSTWPQARHDHIREHSYRHRKTSRHGTKQRIDTSAQGTR